MRYKLQRWCQDFWATLYLHDSPPQLIALIDR